MAEGLICSYRQAKTAMYEAFKAEIKGLEETVEKALKSGDFDVALKFLKQCEEKYPKPEIQEELKVGRGYIRKAVGMYRAEHPKGRVTVADVIRYIHQKNPSIVSVSPAGVANALKGIGLKPIRRKGRRTSYE